MMHTSGKKFSSLDQDRLTITKRMFGNTSEDYGGGNSTKAAQIAQVNLNRTFNMMR